MLSQIIPPSIVLIILADQLGRSIGDMYRGPIAPGLVLTRVYILYIVAMSYIKPKSAPALPPEPRHSVEPDDSRGLTALILLTHLASAVAYFGSQHYFATHPNIPVDEHIVVMLLLWGITAWVIALANKLLRLKLLSRIAERVVFVMIPPLFLIFLVLGTIFIGVATPTEGGAMGAVGAIIMAVSRGRLSWKLLRQAME